MFFDNFVGILLKLFLRIASFISGIALIPIRTVLNGFIPDFSTYESQISTFLDDYLLRGLMFGREVFFNITRFSARAFCISGRFFDFQTCIHDYEAFYKSYC